MEGETGLRGLNGISIDSHLEELRGLWHYQSDEDGVRITDPRNGEERSASNDAINYWVEKANVRDDESNQLCGIRDGNDRTNCNCSQHVEMVRTSEPVDCVIVALSGSLHSWVKIPDWIVDPMAFALDD